MDYKEYNACLQIPQAKSGWFRKEEHVESKLEGIQKLDVQQAVMFDNVPLKQ